MRLLGGDDRMVEVVTLGEAMLRNMDSAVGLLQTVGGAELNVAVALAQLGRNASWLSAVGDDVGGLRILDEAIRVGVDTSSVLILAEHPTGEYTVDFDAGKAWWGLNGVFVGEPAAGTNPGWHDRAWAQFRILLNRRRFQPTF